jgi:hypothetical protein
MTAVMEFDTCFFDDEIQVELFHKNSTANANLVGKAIFTMRELVTGYFYPVTLVNKQHIAGTLFFTTTYQPSDRSLFNKTWPTNLNVADALPDKYEFFNDHLSN